MALREPTVPVPAGVVELRAQPPAAMAPRRPPSGETLSITNKGNPMDWDDDDEGAKTAIAKPGELPGYPLLRQQVLAARKPPVPVLFSEDDLAQKSGAPSETDLQPTEDRPHPLVTSSRTSRPSSLRAAPGSSSRSWCSPFSRCWVS